ncbi:MAG TPA: type I restriction enzyme HsdR N-terminal domain-containing protein [Thermoguttaceae bacterium]
MAIDIRKALKKFAPNFIKAQEDGLTEADTSFKVCKFFEEVLGYDPQQDISHEAQIKNKYIDLCLKIDDRVRLIVEVKRAGLQLRERHIDQAEGYASKGAYHWVLLTNGVDWHLYHLTFDEGIEYEHAFIVSLDTDEALEDAAEKLALLHKKSIAKDELECWWKKTSALNPLSISRALFHEDVLKRLRQEIHRETEHLIDIEDLANKLYEEMFSQEIRNQIGEMRIKKHHKKPKKQIVKDSSATDTTTHPNTSHSLGS